MEKQGRTTEEEFSEAVANLNTAIANLSCGVLMTPNSNFLAGTLYYRCKKYIEIYTKTQY